MSDSLRSNNFVRYDATQVDARVKTYWCVKLGFLFSANAVIPVPPRQDGEAIVSFAPLTFFLILRRKQTIEQSSLNLEPFS